MLPFPSPIKNQKKKSPIPQELELKVLGIFQLEAQVLGILQILLQGLLRLRQGYKSSESICNSFVDAFEVLSSSHTYL